MRGEMKGIRWYECEKQAAQERIDYVSRVVGVTFPKSFVNLMRECDGGTLEKRNFFFYNISVSFEMGSCISFFLSFTQTAYEGDNILGFIESKINHLPEGVVPFGSNGGGDYICFDYRKDRQELDPEIVYWFRGAPEGKSISFVAKSFDAFIEMLHGDDDEDED